MLFICSLLLVAALSWASKDAKFRQAADTHAASLHKTLVQKATKGYFPKAVTVPSPIPIPNGTYSETGFFYLTNSYNTDCTEPYLSYGIPVNQCMIDDGYAYKFQLVQDSCEGGIVQYFFDTECTMYAGNTDLEFVASNCTIGNDKNIIAGVGTVYTEIKCTTSAEPRVQTESVVIGFYDNTTTCSTENGWAYVAYAQGPCISIDDDVTFVANCTTGVPVFDIDLDGGRDCQGSLYPFANPTECTTEANGDDDDGDDDDDGYQPSFIQPPPSVSTTPFPTSMPTAFNNSQMYMCQGPNTPSAEPTAEPTAGQTRAPSIMPTAYPTQSAAAIAGFGAIQEINGISISEYNTNPTLNMNTLVQTIAASMVGTTASNIQSFAAAASTTNPTTAITLTYSVSATSVYTTTELMNQLNQAVASGSFDTMLQANAETNGAAYLDQATCPTIQLFTFQPTRMPSARPTTAYPTSATGSYVSFNGKQTINGITLDTYNSDVATYMLTLQQAIASSMIGVAYTDVQNLVATSATSSAMLKSFHLRVLSSGAIQITYTVSTSSNMDASALESQLTNSVNTGTFNTLMSSYATANGATGLEDATSGPVTITPTDDGGSSNGLSTGELAGIIIGSVVGFALLCGLVYYFMMPKKGLLNQPNVEL